MLSSAKQLLFRFLGKKRDKTGGGFTKKDVPFLYNSGGDKTNRELQKKGTPEC
jgi:hypothetical protein